MVDQIDLQLFCKIFDQINGNKVQIFYKPFSFYMKKK